MGWRFRVRSLLRALESFLLASKSLHVMEKLEYAYKHQFAAMATSLLKQMRTKDQKVHALSAYLEERNLPYPPQHLLQMLDLSQATFLTPS